MCKGNAGYRSNPPWNPSVVSKNSLVSKEWFLSEGIPNMLQRLLKQKVIDDVLVIVESARSPGRIDCPPFHGFVVPEISQADQFIKKGDILFVRGGFRSWHDWLVEKQSKGHWTMLYAANTGRQRWKWWDVILDDLRSNEYEMDIRGRFWVPWKKPTNPNVFYPTFEPIKYDLCIGASYIHDKKGQWRTVKALIEYKNLYGKDLNCVMPGARRHGTETNLMYNTIKKLNLKVYEPGMLDRNKLRSVYNQSKLFVHLGTSGQNDRGPLEAMACGTPIVIGSPKYHAPLLYENDVVSSVPLDITDFKDLAVGFHIIFPQCTDDRRKDVRKYYKKNSGMSNVILPQMKRLISVFKNNPTPNKEALIKEFIHA